MEKRRKKKAKNERKEGRKKKKNREKKPASERRTPNFPGSQGAYPTKKRQLSISLTPIRHPPSLPPHTDPFLHSLAQVAIGSIGSIFPFLLRSRGSPSPG